MKLPIHQGKCKKSVGRWNDKSINVHQGMCNYVAMSRGKSRPISKNMGMLRVKSPYMCVSNSSSYNSNLC